MKNYDVNKVSREVGSMGGVNISNKNITVEENAGLGIGSWGKVDFLTNHAGYKLNIVKAGR